MAAKKKAAKESPPKKASRETGNASSGVTVRMFCHGLGDCFLLTIPQEGTRPYVILIDCGVAMGTAGETVLMQQIAKKIAELTKDAATDKSTIDLLVVTHEHRDHVSGFIQAQAELAEIEFKKVWFAWTEDRGDTLANELRAKHAKEKASLARAFAMASALAGAGQQQRLKSLAGVLAFYAPIPAAKGGKQVNVAEAMAEAGKLQKSGTPVTLLPGKVRRLPDTAEGGTARGVRVFILGPPHKESTLRKINPGKKHPETYEKAPRPTGASLGMDWSWAAAMSSHAAALDLGADADASESERAMPFDDKCRRNLKEVEEARDEFFKNYYFASDAQRRIDGDWLWIGAQRLALYMESYTNNTSLALAFELPNSKKVLLFAADAQVGSWLSWHDVEYQTDDQRTLKAADLLANTVLYKVGHHGSHNATLREKGLEMMIHPELVALLPVETVAVQRLGYGEMPLQSLLTELDKRTEGRILHLDKKWTDGKPPGTWRTGMSKARLADETFQGGADGRPLYMEVTVADKNGT